MAVTKPPSSGGAWRPDAPTLRVAAGLFAAKVGLHLALGARYGYNGDELYFLACGRRLAFGYVDHAPLVPWIARASSELFGDSVRALRVFPALAAGLAIVLTVLIVREWGGRVFAQLVAGLAMLIAPAFLRMGSILCIPVFEPLYWTACAYCIVLSIKYDRPRLWLLVGALAGVGLLNKHTMLFWGAGLVGGLLATPERKHLARVWPWLGGVIALVLVLPNLIWQQRHGWPTLEFIRDIGDDQLNAVPRVVFLVGQVLYMHPISLPLIVAGLWFFFSRAGERYRLFGWMYLVVLAMMFLAHAKPYYIAPIYPVVFAAGAVMVERWLATGRRRLARPVVVVAMLLGGAALAPFALPLLPLPTTDRIIQQLLGPAIRSPADLTLEFHEQYGWPEQAATVADVHRALSDEERKQATILTHDYAEAAAIDFFGPRFGLPSAVSGHMTYWLWGPPDPDPQVVIAYGMPEPTLQRIFTDVRAVATISHPLASAWHTDLVVYVCRAPRTSLRQSWPELKRYRFGDAP
jgi:hypothetical protein